jgi:hypothetical protein
LCGSKKDTKKKRQPGKQAEPSDIAAPLLLFLFHSIIIIIFFFFFLPVRGSKGSSVCPEQ